MNKPLIAAALALLLAACSSSTSTGFKNAQEAYAAGAAMETATRGKKVAFTYEAFIASPTYRESRDMWRGAALAQYAPAASHVEILLNEQRGRLYIKGQIAMDFPICSGRVGGHETPRGSFRISQKAKEYRSNLYGSYVNASGGFVQGGARPGKPGPKGTRFQGTPMPYWMRFNGAIGLHVGAVHRQGESHGCVRVPEEACSILFEKLAVGSRVVVK